MSSENVERIKILLKEKINQLTKEIEILKMCLELISEKSISEEKIEEKPTVHKKIEIAERKLLSSISEDKENIANIYAEGDKIIIVPGKNVEVNVNAKDFKDFFMKKVLLGLKKEKPSITYEIKDVNSILKEIVIKNIIEERDLKRIEGAVKWTFSRFLKSKP